VGFPFLLLSQQLNWLMNFQTFLRVVFLCTVLLPGLPFSGLSQAYDCEEELFSKKDKQTRLFGYVNALGEYRIPPTFLRAKPFVGKNAIVQQGKRFGVLNCEGVLVIPADYEEIASFSNGKGWVKKDGLWGLMDVKGRMLVAPQFEEVREINLYSGSVSWVKKQGLWGLISKENGRMLVPSQYDDISSLSDSAGIGRKTTHSDLVYYGDGRVIISAMRQIKPVGRNLYCYQASDKNWGAFNALAYILVRPEWEALILNGNLIQTEKSGKSGLRDTRGAEIAEPKYQFIQTFQEGFAAVKEGSKWQILNSRGRPVLPFGDSDFANVVNSKLAILGKNKRFGLWNMVSKTWVVAPRLSSVRSSIDNTWLELKDSLGRAYGFDAQRLAQSMVSWDSLSVSDPGTQLRGYRKGKVSVSRTPEFACGSFFDQAFILGNGFVRCSENGKWGILKNQNETILPFVYSEIQPFKTASGYLFSIRQDQKEGLANEKGLLLVSLKYESVKPAKDQMVLARLNGKWGLLNAKEEWVVENKYDSLVAHTKRMDEADFPLFAYRKGKSAMVNAKGVFLHDFMEGKWIFAGEGTFFLFNEGVFSLWNGLGKPAGDLSFENALPFAEGKAPVQIQGKWGFINPSGRLVIPARFEAVLFFQKGIGYAKEKGLWGVMKNNGSWLVKPTGISVEVDSDGKRRLVLP